MRRGLRFHKRPPRCIACGRRATRSVSQVWSSMGISPRQQEVAPAIHFCDDCPRTEGFYGTLASLNVLRVARRVSNRLTAKIESLQAIPYGGQDAEIAADSDSCLEETDLRD